MGTLQPKLPQVFGRRGAEPAAEQVLHGSRSQVHRAGDIVDADVGLALRWMNERASLSGPLDTSNIVCRPALMLVG